MKKYYSAIAIVAGMFMLASCSNDVEESTDNNKKVEMTFGVSAPDGTTRAVVNDLSYDTPAVYWEDGDYISVFTSKATSGDKFKFGGHLSTKNSGKFTGYSYENAGPYIGMYPEQSGAKLVNGALTLNIPDQQTARKNSFDPKAGIQVGKVDSWPSNTTLGLSNVCAYFAVKVEGGCESVVIEAKANAGKDAWYLAGDVTLGNITSASTAITSFGTCQSKIVLTGGDIKDGGTFLVAFIPSTKCPKIVATATYWPNTDDQKQVNIACVPKTDKDSFQFEAGKIYPLPSLCLPEW